MNDISALVPGGVLTDMQLRFVDEYLIDMNATQAAIRAGYEPQSAHNQGWRMMRNEEIRRALAARRKLLAQKFDITHEDIIMKLMQTADQASQGTPVLEWDPEEKAMMPSGEWQFDGKTVTRCWELIAKMLGFIDAKTPEGGGGGLILNIITRAAQLEAAKIPVTIDQPSVSHMVSHEASR